ncbi:DUF1552 domain-containing protein [Schlesneria paludicola]|uniref:DUF1552 domain-containing protein n=1 Tax=Schlesneria paludicola TaxID=360056 RepID=UPI00029ACF78|nr:DUF1552 domain-containing protein [Schlesneria paludicola]
MIALPAFESFGSLRRLASAADNFTPRPKRVVFLGFGYGVTNETWFPDVKQTGSSYTLPEGLRPLERHKSDFSIIQGMSNQYNNEAHWGSTFWLTGANRYSQPGQSFHNSISADQVAAANLGTDTRFSSIQLGSEDVITSGHGPGLSLAWDARGKPISGLDNPVTAFHRMFSADSLSLEERQAKLLQHRSVLDAVLSDARRVERRLNRTDADKLDEYFQSIRDIEVRLSKDEQWLTVPKPGAPLPAPNDGLAGRDEIRMMYELIVAAFKTDSTRVITYRQPVGTLLKSLSIKFAPHDVSHYTPGERTMASQQRDIAQSELLSGLIDQLKATKEPDGSSLFDHTILVYGSNIRTIHYLDNCPTLIAGRGAGLKLGEHIVLKEKHTPLCNLWLTLLNGVGANVKSHGDSTGVVSDVQSA